MEEYTAIKIWTTDTCKDLDESHILRWWKKPSIKQYTILFTWSWEQAELMFKRVDISGGKNKYTGGTRIFVYWNILGESEILFFDLDVNISFLKKNLFISREWEGEREGNINVWLPLVHPLLGTWPTTQACALTRNRTSDPLVHSPVLSPLSHTSQGWVYTSWYKYTHM